MFKLLAVLAVAAYLLERTVMTMTEHTAAQIPADPAGRRAFIRAVIASQDLSWQDEDGNTYTLPVDALLAQSSVETADFTSNALKVTNSLFNRHEGSGRGDWNHLVDNTPSGEPLREYDSLEESVRDMVELLGDPLYKDAAAAAAKGDIPGYFAAVAKGDGKQGFVGPPNTDKARAYVAALLSRFKELGA